MTKVPPPDQGHRTRTNVRAQPFSSTNDWEPATGEWTHTNSKPYIDYLNRMVADVVDQMSGPYNDFITRTPTQETDARPQDTP